MNILSLTLALTLSLVSFTAPANAAFFLRKDASPVKAKVETTEARRHQPMAYIYKGPGSCSLEQGDAGNSGYGCSEASADAAKLAGFDYKFIGPNDLPDFTKAKVWIQPGGISNVAYYAMTQALRNAVVEFVSKGGGYVGFCAGAYLAADWFYIFPGYADDHYYSSARSDVGYGFLDVEWAGQKRSLYFEGGPHLTNIQTGVEVMARFSTGHIAAARNAYNKGRVYISGPHPEAPSVWSEEDGIHDPDGSDLDIAAVMIAWAAGQD